MTWVRGHLFFAVYILLCIAGTFFYLRHNTVSVLDLHDYASPSARKMVGWMNGHI